MYWRMLLLRYPLAGGKFGGEWWESVFGDLAAILSSVGIAPSTYATYAADWKMWVEWRQTVVRKGTYVDMSQGAEAVAVEIAKFMAYFFFPSQKIRCPRWQVNS